MLAGAKLEQLLGRAIRDPCGLPLELIHRAMSGLIERTHGLAVVAAEDPRPQSRAEFRRNRRRVLDGEVRNAAASVELPLLNQCAGRTRIDALSTGPAAGCDGRSRQRKRLVDQEFAQEKTAADPRRDEHGVLGDEPESGTFCQRALEERCRVHASASCNGGAEPRGDRVREIAEPLFQHQVVVRALRVCGDVSVGFPGPVRQGCDHDRARRVEQLTGRVTPRPDHVPHIGGKAGLQPGVQSGPTLRELPRVRDANAGKPERRRHFTKPIESDGAPRLAGAGEVASGAGRARGRPGRRHGLAVPSGLRNKRAVRWFRCPKDTDPGPRSASDDVIEIKQLYKYYGQNRAVGPVSAKIERGEIVGLLGLNGAGKTTTLRILACDLLPSSGQVTVAGADVAESPEKIRRSIGYLPDSPPLYDEMRVSEYLAYAAELRGFAKGKIAARVREVEKLTGVSKVRTQVIGTLSHGYRQRVGIAQAVVHEPDFVILDEPISGLDPKQIVQMRRLVRSLKGKHTVLISSHILSEISETCDRILVIRDGEIADSGTEKELIGKLTRGERVRLVCRLPDGEGVGDADAERLRDVLAATEQVTDVQCTARGGELTVQVAAADEVRPQLAKAVIESGFELLGLSRGERELEQVFLELARGVADEDDTAKTAAAEPDEPPPDDAPPDEDDGSDDEDDEDDGSHDEDDGDEEDES